jgi:hypothetical protein
LDTEKPRITGRIIPSRNKEQAGGEEDQTDQIEVPNAPKPVKLEKNCQYNDCRHVKPCRRQHFILEQRGRHWKIGGTIPVEKQPNSVAFYCERGRAVKGVCSDFRPKNKIISFVDRTIRQSLTNRNVVIIHNTRKLGTIIKVSPN